MPVTYDVAKQELSCKDQKAPLKPMDGRLRLRLLVDRTSIDLFGNDGQLYMSVGVIVPSENRLLEVFAKGEGAAIDSMQVYEMEPAWR